jgi:hypothetical protein
VLLVSGFAIILTSLPLAYSQAPSAPPSQKSPPVRVEVRIQPIANTISGTFKPFEVAVGGRPIFKQSQGVRAVRIDGKEFVESKDSSSFFLKLQADRVSLEVRPEESDSFAELFKLEFPKILSASAQVLGDGKMRIELRTQATTNAQVDGAPFDGGPLGDAQHFMLIRPDLKSLEDGLLVELSGARQVLRTYQLDFIDHRSDALTSLPHLQTDPQPEPQPLKGSQSPNSGNPATVNQSPPPPPGGLTTPPAEAAQASDGRSFLEKLHDIGSPGIYGAIHLVPTVEDRLAVFGFRFVGKKPWSADLHFVYTGPTAHTSFGFGGSGYYRVLEFRSKKKTSISLDLGWFFRAVNQTLNNSVQTSHWQWIYNSGPTVQIDPIRLGPVWIGFQLEAPLIRINNPVGIFSVPVNLGAQISIMI